MVSLALGLASAPQEIRGMRVPNRDRAIVDTRKLREYLLSPTHPVGRFKAHYFATLGYEVTEWQALEADLRATLESNAVRAVAGEFGTKCVGRSNITGRNGTHARLITVWIIPMGEEIPRLVTAYPEN